MALVRTYVRRACLSSNASFPQLLEQLQPLTSDFLSPGGAVELRSAEAPTRFPFSLAPFMCDFALQVGAAALVPLGTISWALSFAHGFVRGLWSCLRVFSARTVLVALIFSTARQRLRKWILPQSRAPTFGVNLITDILLPRTLALSMTQPESAALSPIELVRLAYLNPVAPLLSLIESSLIVLKGKWTMGFTFFSLLLSPALNFAIARAPWLSLSPETLGQVFAIYWPPLSLLARLVVQTALIGVFSLSFRRFAMLERPQPRWSRLRRLRGDTALAHYRRDLYIQIGASSALVIALMILSIW